MNINGIFTAILAALCMGTMRMFSKKDWYTGGTHHLLKLPDDPEELKKNIVDLHKVQDPYESEIELLLEMRSLQLPRILARKKELKSNYDMILIKGEFHNFATSL